MSRPEHQAPPEIFYNDTEAKKYTSNSHIIDVQTRLTERALELLALPDDSPKLLLDIGCGSGLSGGVLEQYGHMFVGLDIAPSMLEIAAERDDVNGDLFLWDMGQGLSFRPGMFDGAVSISAVQWLCNADRKENNPVQRINRFFQSLYVSLARGARAVLQLYPESPNQVELLTSAAMRAGFGGGLVVDFPNSTRAKKYYLVLWAGSSGAPQKMPEAQTGEPTSVQFEASRIKQIRKKSGKGQREPIKGREWVLAKKDRQRRQGKEVRPDSKYSGRSRKPRF